MPARIARVAVSQRAIERKRRAAAGQHQMKRAPRCDGGFGFGAQRSGQRGHQRIGIGEHPPFGQAHSSLRQIWSSLSNSRLASAGPQLPAA